jgi:hypothetical protein
MHPHLLYQLATARNHELRERIARASATRPARSAVRRWSRWLHRMATAAAGGRLERDPGPITIRSSEPRTTSTSTLSAER